MVLCRQLGIVQFEPLRPYFLELYQGSHAALPMLPAVPPAVAGLDRSWSSDKPRQEPTSPALVSGQGGVGGDGLCAGEGNTARGFVVM